MFDITSVESDSFDQERCQQFGEKGWDDVSENMFGRLIRFAHTGS